MERGLKGGTASLEQVESGAGPNLEAVVVGADVISSPAKSFDRTLNGGYQNPCYTWG